MNQFIALISAFPGLIQTLIELVKVAEAIFPDKGSGSDKKAFVLSTMEKILENTDFWKLVQDLLSKAINLIAAIFVNASGKEPSPK